MTTVQAVQAANAINDVVNTTETVIKQVDMRITTEISMVVTFFASQSKKILRFLIDKNVISAGIAIIVGTQIGKITGAFVDYLLSPFINLILAGETKNFEDYEVVMYGVHFKVGLFLSNLIQFLINMAIVYYIFAFSKMSSEGLGTLIGQAAVMEGMGTQ